MGTSSSQQETDKLGYRVLGVQPNSPASKGGLVSFFDFIVAANGIPLQSLDSTFIDLIKASEENPLPLTIYNWKNGSLREIVLTPSRNWPGEGMLGVTIRFDSYRDAEEQMLHVLEVQPNSPAELAGLQPFTDYLLGTAEKAFVDAEVLQHELQDKVDRPVEFYVYSSESDEVRVVVIMPTQDWGGDGLLGADVASGYLHVLPANCCETIGISNEAGSSRAFSSPFGMHGESTDPAEGLGTSTEAGADMINSGAQYSESDASNGGPPGTGAVSHHAGDVSGPATPGAYYGGDASSSSSSNGASNISHHPHTGSMAHTYSAEIDSQQQYHQQQQYQQQQKQYQQQHQQQQHSQPGALGGSVDMYEPYHLVHAFSPPAAPGTGPLAPPTTAAAQQS